MNRSALAYETITDPSEGPIRLHNSIGFEGMRRAGKLAAEVLDMLTPHVVPDVVTLDLDKLAYDYVCAAGAASATIFYRGFSHSLCISVNHVVCHGIPSARKLKEGDIVNIDVTVVVDGWHGDTSRMFLVGDVPLKAKKLVDVTYECLMLGIEAARPGATLGDVGHAIAACIGSSVLARSPHQHHEQPPVEPLAEEAVPRVLRVGRELVALEELPALDPSLPGR
jgi:methionyl aminopeptidase